MENFIKLVTSHEFTSLLGNMLLIGIFVNITVVTFHYVKWLNKDREGK